MFEEAFKTQLTLIQIEQLQVDKLWNEISNHYSEPSRHYHNLSHLDILLEHPESVKDKIHHWQIAIFALAYHGIIYNILKQNNEQKSDQLAEKRLLEIGLPNALIEKCKQMILTTKDHQKNADDDINYFNDADMAILGSNSGSYQLYVKNIRKEYSYYPDVIYRPGRLKVLQYFFKMDRIYIKLNIFLKILNHRPEKTFNWKFNNCYSSTLYKLIFKKYLSYR